MLTRTISKAPQLWHHLNGVVNVYKPAGVSSKQVQKTIITNICRDLNEFEVRPPREIVKIDEFHDTNGAQRYLIKQEPDLADDVLVVGERYQNIDLKSVCSCYLGRFSSGVLVIGINRGTKTAFKIRDNRPIRVYHITGRFGRSTESHFNDSPVTLRASYDNITLNKLNSFLASLESSHQKKMFEMCGVDIQTQAAFELAVQGPLRPTVSNIPLLYGIRCINFQKPFFTIEVHAVNESEAYLGILIHEIGLNLKTVAYCKQVRCIRQAHFTLENALVRRHWNVKTLLNSITQCNEMLKNHPEMLHQLDATLKEEQ